MTGAPETPTRETLRVGDLTLSYVSAGSGPTVLLLHGWPTSSFLWRETIAPLARVGRVLALDLPGFGDSDKPLDRNYSFPFFERVLSGFLDALEIDALHGLAVHDLGGPVGMYWALRNQARVRSLALLNTLIYPRPSWAVVAFILASYTPGLRSFLTSPRGLAFALRVGLADKRNATPAAIEGVQRPFRTKSARAALLKAAHGLHPGGMKTIARLLPTVPGPVRVIYGERDRILPDVARTMEHVARDLPQTVTTRFPDCGHFLQEERGAEIGELLAEFFRDVPAQKSG